MTLGLIKKNLSQFKHGDFSPSDVSKNSATFSLSSLPRGFATTIGNMMRRILLSSISSHAIVAISIDGVSYEFGGIAGIREDIIDIVLNFKLVTFLSDELEFFKASITIEKSDKPMTVTSGMINLPEGVSVLDPSIPLFDIDSGVNINIHIYVVFSSGYSSCTDNAKKYPRCVPGHPIYFDVNFSPIKRCTFHTDYMRKGEISDYEVLNLVVNTNGSIAPQTALGIAAKIAQKQLAAFVNFRDEGGDDIQKEQDILPFDYRLLLDLSSINTKFTPRIHGCFIAKSIIRLGDLVACSESELLSSTNFGRKSYELLKSIIIGLGLKFGMKIKDWPSDRELQEQMASKYQKELNLLVASILMQENKKD